MTDAITVQVFRYDPDHDAKPRYQEYPVPVEEETSVLVLLNRIQQEMDETLSFRSYCCGLQMCGSCVMKIDGKKRYACLTLVKPGQKVTLEPVTFPGGHIKDLVVKVKEGGDRSSSLPAL
jgi:succinate dehydrogenase/fumarate reductase-like Fe-S protein